MNRNLFLEGYFLGCMQPELSMENVLLISNALCQSQSEQRETAQSATHNSIPLSQEGLEKLPFALIAEMHSRH